MFAEPSHRENFLKWISTFIFQSITSLEPKEATFTQWILFDPIVGAIYSESIEVIISGTVYIHTYEREVELVHSCFILINFLIGRMVLTCISRTFRTSPYTLTGHRTTPTSFNGQNKESVEPFICLRSIIYGDSGAKLVLSTPSSIGKNGLSALLYEITKWKVIETESSRLSLTFPCRHDFLD